MLTSENGEKSGHCPWDLNVQIRAVNQFAKSPSFPHRADGVVRQMRGNLQAHITVEARRRLMDIEQEIACFLYVADQQLFIDIVRAASFAGQAPDILVIIAAGESRPKRRWIGGDTAEPLIPDSALQLSIAKHCPG